MVFIDIAISKIKKGTCHEFEKIKREHQYVIKSKRLLKHYTGVIASKLGMKSQPLLRSIYDELEVIRISDGNANRHRIAFRVGHSKDRFLYGLAIEARGQNRHQVVFVSNDHDQLENSAHMLTSERIPIVNSHTYLEEYC